MKIIVCMKQVPATTEVDIDPVTGVMKRQGIEVKLNPYDLFAIETALQICSAHNSYIVGLTMGPPQAEQALLEACYMGADHGYLLTDRKFAGADVVATSYTLAQGVNKIGEYNLIICGKQTTDGDTAQVGPEMAEFLGIPHVANVIEIMDLSENHIIVKMNMEDTVEIQNVKLPCLITVDKDIYTPRLPSYKRKLQIARLGENKITHFSLKDLADQDESKYGLKGSPTQVERIFPPTNRFEQQKFEGNPVHLSQIIYDLLKSKKFV